MTGRGALPAAPIDPIDVVVRRFRAAGLHADDATGIAALRESCASAEEHPAGIELMQEGRRARPMILLEGWAARVWHLPDGRRQILYFLLPGDVAGFAFIPSPPEFTTLVALTPVRIAACQALQEALLFRQDLAKSDPGRRDLGGVAAAVHAAARGMEELLIDQVVRLGRRTAYERMCHLLLELHARLDAVGRVRNAAFAMPLTQETLADATGLSIVHVNRTLQQLRRDGLLELKNGEARLMQLELMAAIADYRLRPGIRPTE